MQRVPGLFGDALMKFALLASGSKGNCFLYKDENTSLMIDCGTTRKYLTGCFAQLKFDPADLDAVLITIDLVEFLTQSGQRHAEVLLYLLLRAQIGNKEIDAALDLGTDG